MAMDHHSVSPTRRYVAICWAVSPVDFKYRGFRFQRFALPEVDPMDLEYHLENSSATAEWYYLNRLDSVSAIQGCVAAEDVEGMTDRASFQEQWAAADKLATKMAEERKERLAKEANDKSARLEGAMPARLDTDKCAKPKTRLIGKVYPGDCVQYPGHASEYEDERGERTPLKSSPERCSVCGFNNCQCGLPGSRY